MALEKYPKSGLYRENRVEVDAHANKLVEKLKREIETGEKISWIFNMSEEEWTTVTPEEKEDIINFAEYAAPRLANASQYSPTSECMIQRGDVQRAVSHQSREGIFVHDLMHAMVAYYRTKGESLRPMYSKVVSDVGPEAATNTDIIQEELFAGLFSTARSYGVMKTNDPVIIEEPPHAGKQWLLFGKPYAEYVEKSRPLLEEDPLRYYMEVEEAGLKYQALYPQAFHDMNSVDKVVSFVAEHRDPEYVRIFSEIYENAHSENPDPKILLHEFQRILQPLLERLRNKGENSTSGAG